MRHPPHNPPPPRHNRCPHNHRSEQPQQKLNYRHPSKPNRQTQPAANHPVLPKAAEVRLHEAEWVSYGCGELWGRGVGGWWDAEGGVAESV